MPHPYRGRIGQKTAVARTSLQQQSSPCRRCHMVVVNGEGGALHGWQEAPQRVLNRPGLTATMCELWSGKSEESKMVRGMSSRIPCCLDNLLHFTTNQCWETIYCKTFFVSDFMMMRCCLRRRQLQVSISIGSAVINPILFWKKRTVLFFFYLLLNNLLQK